jgi:hypothetical protein
MHIRIRREAHRHIRQVRDVHIDYLIRNRIVEYDSDLSLHDISPRILPRLYLSRRIDIDVFDPLRRLRRPTCKYPSDKQRRRDQRSDNYFSHFHFPSATFRAVS